LTLGTADAPLHSGLGERLVEIVVQRLVPADEIDDKRALEHIDLMIVDVSGGDSP
jgi:hypothetical protein